MCENFVPKPRGFWETAMAVKDISDELVCKAINTAQKNRTRWPYEYLQSWTGQPEKVCYRALERAEERGLIEYGVSLRTGWLTEKGEQLLKETNGKEGL